MKTEFGLERGVTIYLIDPEISNVDLFIFFLRHLLSIFTSRGVRSVLLLLGIVSINLNYPENDELGTNVGCFQLFYVTPSPFSSSSFE